jgi:hypothetical protein
MKALSKKRKHQVTRNLSVNLSEASILKYQALWYASFIAVYVWFLYWVAYDFFIWHKPIFEINVANYAGSVASIAFIWAGTKIWKRNRTEAQTLRQKPISMPQNPSQPKPKPPQKTSPPPTPVNSTCAHYLGYLNQRQKQQEIPAECLTCEKVIECFSSAK